MTLHVAYICPWFTMTVGDRLLTTSGEDGIAPFDALTNKTVVLMSSDCAVAISYTGLAHVDGSSTANWIGEQVLNFKLSEPMRPGAGHPLQGSPAPRTNLRQIVSRLRTALERDLPRQDVNRPRRDATEKQGIEVAILGYVMKRRWRFDPADPRNARPVYLHLAHDGGPGLTRVSSVPRMWRDSPRTFKIDQIGTPMPGDVYEALVRGLRANGPSMEAVEGLLVDAIRKTSEVRPAVGNECMTVEFVRGDPHVAVTFNRDPAKTSAAYAPFIAGPVNVLPPTIIRGPAPLPIDNGGWMTHLQVNPPLPPSDDGLLFAIGGHPQKPFPA